MSGAKAMARLARASLQRWNAAMAAGDNAVLAFLRWHSSGREGHVARVLAPLSGAEQVKTLAAPVVVRSRRRANGGGETVTDAHIEAIIADVRRLWERDDSDTPASDRPAGRSRKRSNGPISGPRDAMTPRRGYKGAQPNADASPLTHKADGSQRGTALVSTRTKSGLDAPSRTRTK